MSVVPPPGYNVIGGNRTFVLSHNFQLTLQFFNSSSPIPPTSSSPIPPTSSSTVPTSHTPQSNNVRPIPPETSSQSTGFPFIYIIVLIAVVLGIGIVMALIFGRR
ncbi:hypothetical protein [Sulfuracidifex tepidarius]|nr:hypothetical protein [Sulfuracidifex tepidarius]